MTVTGDGLPVTTEVACHSLTSGTGDSFLPVAAIAVFAAGGHASPAGVQPDSPIPSSAAKASSRRAKGKRPASTASTSRMRPLPRFPGLPTCVDAGVSGITGGKRTSSSRGEVLFTDYGLSGPAILDISREASLCGKNAPFRCLLDLLPGMGRGEVLRLLAGRRRTMQGRPPDQLFLGMFHERLGRLLTEHSGLLRYGSIGAMDNAALERATRKATGWWAVSPTRTWASDTATRTRRATSPILPGATCAPS